MTVSRKIHFNDSCTGFPWSEELADRAKFVTNDPRRVTCGQCKGQILNVIRDRDWSTLSDKELETISTAASSAFLEE